MLLASTIREVLRVFSLKPNCATRKGGQLAGCSKNSYARVITKATEIGIDIQKAEELSDEELLTLFYPKNHRQKARYRLPDFKAIEIELQKKGKKRKSLDMLHLEYCQSEPETAYGFTQFRFYLTK